MYHPNMHIQQNFPYQFHSLYNYLLNKIYLILPPRNSSASILYKHTQCLQQAYFLPDKNGNFTFTHYIYILIKCKVKHIFPNPIALCRIFKNI